MNPGVLPHFVDTSVLIHYAERGQDESNPIFAYMECKLLAKYTSTAPYEEYTKTYRMVGTLTTGFLREIKNDTALIQSKELREEILDRFANYSSNSFPHIAKIIQRKVTSLVNQYIPEIAERAERHRSGTALSEAVEDCIQDVDDLVRVMQGCLVRLCRDGYVKCYTVGRGERYSVRNAQYLKRLFDEIDDRRSSDVLEEAYHIRKAILNLSNLCLVTWRPGILNHQNKIKKNRVGIYPASPEKIFELHKDLIYNSTDIRT